MLHIAHPRKRTNNKCDIPGCGMDWDMQYMDGSAMCLTHDEINEAKLKAGEKGLLDA